MECSINKSFRMFGGFTIDRKFIKIAIASTSILAFPQNRERLLKAKENKLTGHFPSCSTLNF